MSDDERHIYELVETYIRETYNKASASTKTAVGFVMTIYRKRLASSFYALDQDIGETLWRRSRRGWFHLRHNG
jgi:outer membrane protein assembly factor BamB